MNNKLTRGEIFQNTCEWFFGIVLVLFYVGMVILLFIESPIFVSSIAAVIGLLFLITHIRYKRQ